MVHRHFLWKIHSPECSVNEKIPKNFWPQILCDQKKMVLRHFLWKIHSPECSVNEKNSEKFITSNSALPKKVGAHTTSLKYSESRVLCKLENFEKFLT